MGPFGAAALLSGFFALQTGFMTCIAVGAPASRADGCLGNAAIAGAIVKPFLALAIGATVARFYGALQDSEEVAHQTKVSMAIQITLSWLLGILVGLLTHAGHIKPVFGT
jgi:hypothetical protein